MPIEVKVSIFAAIITCITAGLSILTFKYTSAAKKILLLREKMMLRERASKIALVLLPASISMGVFVSGVECPGERGCRFAMAVSSYFGISPTQAIGFAMILVTMLCTALVFISPGKNSENH